MECPTCDSTNIYRTTPEKCVCRDCLNVFESRQSSEEIKSLQNTKSKNSTKSSKNADKISTIGDLVSSFKEFNLYTCIGFALEIIFIILCFRETIIFRWWIMLTIAFLSAGFFSWKRNQVYGFERKICIYGIWSVVILLLIRDIYLSHLIGDMINTFSSIDKSFDSDPVDNLFK